MSRSGSSPWYCMPMMIAPEALDTLFRHANNISLGSEYTLIMLYAQENDPVFRSMKKFTGISVRSEMYLFAKDAGLY